MRKPTFCINKNKGADQLCSNFEADKCLCFRFMDSTILFILNPKFPASRHLLCWYSSACVVPVWKPHCSFSHDAAHMLKSTRQIDFTFI